MTATALDLPGLAAAPKWRRRLRNIPWVLVPLLSLLAVFFAWPGVQLLMLTGVDTHGSPTFAHYVRLFASPIYLQVLAITFKIAAWTNPLTFLGGYPMPHFPAAARHKTPR